MKQKLIIGCFILLTIPTIRDLFKPGAYTSHDLTHHIVRTIHMDKILSEGQFPPRWVGDLNWGYGYPLFLFNYPLPSFMAVGFHKLGLNFIWSVKMTMALSMVSSAIFAYIFLRYLFKSELAGFTGGLFYLYAPIRFLNVYVSATFGNAVAFMFVPLIFWAITKASRGEFDKKSLILGSLSLAGLILSHNIMALMFLPIVGAYSLFSLWQIPSKSKRLFILHSSFIILLGLGLSSFFLLPAIFEKSLIRYDSALTGFYKTHFPAWWQLIRSHWGYGFSHPGTAQDDMSFQIGLAHILVVIISILVIAKRILLKGLTLKEYPTIFFLVVFAVSILLMLEISTPIWETTPLLPYLQMPWRLLAVSIFTASILAAWLVSQLRFHLPIALFLSLAVLIANRNHLRINEILPLADADYMSINNSTTMASEHLPLGSNKFDNIPPPPSKITISEGDIDIITNNSSYVHAVVTTSEPTSLTFNQVYFPGWKYTLNGQPITGSFKPNFPIPVFPVPAGRNIFTASFGRTSVRTIADIITPISLGTLAYVTQSKKLLNN